MPRTAAQNKALRDQTRALILRHALKLFAHHGYDGTSLRMIADSAEVAQGLAYRHFRSKDAILVALFEQSMADVRQTFAAAAAGTTPEERLERLLRAAAQVAREHLDFWRTSYGVRHQPAVRRALGRRLKAWTDEIGTVLATLFAAAGVPHPQREAAILFATIDGVCQHFALQPRTYPLDAIMDALAARYRAQLSAPRNA